ncbi:MAG: hypothetical protein IJX17_02650 [Clostridia bacterium]|nr:hypothetical protein [Clostridia bacterium]
MNESQKLLLLSYFNNEETMRFMCMDFFEELKLIIPKNLIYCKENSNDKIRDKNREKVKEIIIKFLTKNEVYYNEIKKLYHSKNLDFIDDIIDAYVITLLIDKTHIFKDKNSIAYKDFW